MLTSPRCFDGYMKHKLFATRIHCHAWVIYIEQLVVCRSFDANRLRHQMSWPISLVDHNYYYSTSAIQCQTY